MGDEGQNKDVVTEGAEIESTGTKTFDDVLKDTNYQSEFDKRVQKALETAKSKWQQDAEKQKTEAEKLASMKTEEKLQYQLDQERKQKSEYEGKLKAYELRQEAQKIAISPEMNIDVSLLDLIDYSTVNAEQLNEKLTNIKTAFDGAVEKRINERLKEKSPVNNAGEGTEIKDVPKLF